MNVDAVPLMAIHDQNEDARCAQEFMDILDRYDWHLLAAARGGLYPQMPRACMWHAGSAIRQA